MQYLRYLLVFFSLCSLALLACGDSEQEANNDSNNMNNGTDEVPEELAERCEVACSEVYQGCEQNFVYDDDTAMTESGCVDECVDNDMFMGGEWCVATEAECKSEPVEMIHSCVFADDPDDPEELCEAACESVYERCDEMFLREGGGAMSQGACVDECMDNDIFHGGQWCIATVAQCQEPQDMIEACLPDDYHPEACAELGVWDHDVTALEEEVVELVNGLRGDGFKCPVEVADPDNPGETMIIDEEMPPVEALEMDKGLRCAARLHSAWMNENSSLSTTGEDGSTGAERAEAAGYVGTIRVVVDQGYTTAYNIVMDGWAESTSGHCQNMMSPDYEDIGVGMKNRWWTQKLGKKDE